MATKKLDAKALANVTKYLLRARREESARLSEIHERVKNRIIDIYVPDKATNEYRQIVDQSRFNVLPLLISALANNLFIDGYRPAKQADNAPIWDKVWQPNRMDARQAGLWRSALEYGVSYATVLPGKLNGENSAVITPWSPRRLTALYADPTNDEWPMYFMTVGTSRPVFDGDKVTHVTPVAVYDDTWRYEMNVSSAAVEVPVYLGRDNYSRVPLTTEAQFDATKAVTFEHAMGFAPVVRFLESFGDLDEGPEGVVWPMLPAQRRLNQTTYSLGMAELYAAFKQRWVTGMVIQEDENGVPIEPFNAAVDRIFQAEDADTRFGEFGQTELDGYLNSRDKTLLYVSSVRQLLPHTLVVGDAVSNISAEALAELAAGHGQDVSEHQTAFGEGGEQLMRGAGKAVGDTEAWADTSAQVRWRDTTPRSLAQVADALGKLAQMLEIPAQELWERIPGVTDQDLARWKEAAKSADFQAKLAEVLNARPGRTPANAGTSG